MLQGSLFAIGPRSRLGMLGEQLAGEVLLLNGFNSVRNLNKVRYNNVFADIAAERNGESYLISVKARNILSDIGKINASYNILKISNSRDRELKLSGLSTDEITSKLYEELGSLCAREASEPAWVAISIDTKTATFSAYFGLVRDLRRKRSIPMTIASRSKYEALAMNCYDARITPDLSNARPAQSI